MKMSKCMELLNQIIDTSERMAMKVTSCTGGVT